MKVVVLGAGNVGSHFMEFCEDEHLKVTLIDKSAKALEPFKNKKFITNLYFGKRRCCLFFLFSKKFKTTEKNIGNKQRLLKLFKKILITRISSINLFLKIQNFFLQ